MRYPVFKYQENNVVLDELLMPLYPNNFGEKTHSIRSDIHQYGNMRRRIGTTKLRMSFKDMIRSAWEELYDFWHDYMNKGQYQGSYIDSESRVLFHANMSLDWDSEWDRRNGGRWKANLTVESPFLFSPKSQAMFFYLNNNSTFDNFNLLTNKSLILNTASLIPKSVYGYYMEEFQLGTARKSGATNVNCSYDFTDIDGNPGSFTLFCQYRVGSMGSSSSPLSLIHIDNYHKSAYNEVFELSIVAAGGTDHYLSGKITTGGTDYATPTITHERRQWFDVAMTYDAVGEKLYLYTTKTPSAAIAHPTANDDFTDYLTDANDLTYQLTSVTLGQHGLPEGARIYFNTDFVAGNSLVHGEPIRAMNHMIFNDFITPSNFNMLRYICYQYNTKGEFPK